MALTLCLRTHATTTCRLWNALLTHFREQGLLVEGALAALQVSQMRFPVVKKYYRDRRQREFDEHAKATFSGDRHVLRTNTSQPPHPTNSRRNQQPRR